MTAPQLGHVPYADERWSEIIPGLWQGGHFTATDRVIVRNEFDLVVSLFRMWGHGPDADVEHRTLEIPDAELTGHQLTLVYHQACYVARAVAAGRRTLVRCRAGYNRSGLVVAQALIHQGHDPDEAVALIRRQRSPYALFNTAFLGYLGVRNV